LRFLCELTVLGQSSILFNKVPLFATKVRRVLFS